MKKILVSLLSLFAAGTTYGAFSIQMDAGQLRTNSSTGLPVGSVLIFITAGADGIFQTPTGLKQGSYVAGDDVLLSVVSDPNSAQAFNISGGTNETINLFSISNVTPPTGQLLGLMWFPSITYTQWQAGATPVAGQTFGFYNPLFWGNGTNNPDGGNNWAVPATGLITLNFFTTDSGGGGTQAPSEGYGNNFVVAIPEPSSIALVAIGALALIGLRRRTKV
jgi:hypothetical protein